MPTIAIVDDRHEPRESVRRAMSLHVPEGWDVVDSPPLGSIAEYPSWIIENDVAAFIVDERLQEQAPDAEGHADYNGHQVVDYIRPLLPTLPIFFITSYPEATDVAARFGKVEEIIPRMTFALKSKDFVDRFVRSGQKYLESNEGALAELADLSMRIAGGGSTNEDRIRAQAIQSMLGIPFSGGEIHDRAEWIEEMSKRLRSLERLQNEIEVFLEGLKR